MVLPSPSFIVAGFPAISLFLLYMNFPFFVSGFNCCLWFGPTVEGLLADSRAPVIFPIIS
jgi:hypothetical protein